MTSRGTWLNLLSVCVGLVGSHGCSRIALGVDLAIGTIISAEAFSGTPLGVGRMDVQFPPGGLPRIVPGQLFWLTEKEDRVLYPVYSVSETRVPVDKGAGNVDRVTVLFLFRGNETLDLVLDVELSHRERPVPRDDERGYAQLLAEWWRQYSVMAQRLAFEDGYSPQIENYLTATLSRRLSLPLPTGMKPWWRQHQWWREEALGVFGTLLGAESVRLAIQKETLLRTTKKLEPANLAPPTPAAPPPIDVPVVPGDVTIEPMAQHVPAECFYVRFGSFSNFQWLRATMDEWGGNLRNLIAVRGLDYEIRDRLERQLALRETVLSKLLGVAFVADVGLIGSDTFFREGAAFGLLFQARNSAALRTALSAQRLSFRTEEKKATDETVEIGGKKVSLLATPDNAVHSFYAVDGDYHLVTTSRKIVRRFFEAGKGTDALGGLKEFRYARTLMPVSRDDTVFVYLSDPFFRVLVGPEYRVEMTRRMQAEAEIELVHLARLAAAAERLPADTLDQLVAGGFLPEGFGQRPDGSRPVLTAGSVVDSLRGARRSFLPIPDVTIAGLTDSEMTGYEEFARMYRNQWQRMDPVTVGLKRIIESPEEHAPRRERVVMDVHISPYAQQHYGFLAGLLAPADKQRLAPIKGNLLEIELRLGRSFLTAAAGQHSPERVFAGLCDFNVPFGISAGGVAPGEFGLERIPGYLGQMPGSPAFLLSDNADVPEGYSEPSQSWPTMWKYRSDDFRLLSTQKSTLEAVVPHVRREAAARPAQLRLRLADLSETGVAPILNAYGYTHTRSVSAGNVHFLHALMQQLQVPAEDALAVAGNVLGAKVVCPLAAQYELVKFGPGPVRWKSAGWVNEYMSQEHQFPANYRFPFLDWFHGLESELTIDRTTLTTHIELALQPQSLK